MTYDVFPYKPLYLLLIIKLITNFEKLRRSSIINILGSSLKPYQFNRAVFSFLNPGVFVVIAKL